MCVIPWYAVELKIAHVSRIDLKGETGQRHACIIKVPERTHRLKVIFPALRIDQVKVRHDFEMQEICEMIL
jgi:hypothetical protein